MKKYLAILVAFAAIFSSCQEDELTLTHKFSGTLSVTLKTAEGAAIEGVTLNLSDDGAIIDELKTDANGHVNFGSVNSGNYRIFAEDVKDGEYQYSFSKPVQVVAASTKEITIIPSEYNTSVSIRIGERLNYEQETPLGSDVKIALLKLPNNYMYYSDELVFEDIKEFIISEQNADGKKEEYTFENIPMDLYNLLVYTNEDYFTIATSFSAYQKGETEIIKTRVESTEIREYRIDQKFSVRQRDYSSSYYNAYIPYSACNIYVVKSEDYQNLSYTGREDMSTISSLAIAHGTSDEGGLAIINVLRYKSLYAVCFSPEGEFVNYDYFSIGQNVYDNTITFTKY